MIRLYVSSRNAVLDLKFYICAFIQTHTPEWICRNIYTCSMLLILVVFRSSAQKIFLSKNFILFLFPLVVAYNFFTIYPLYHGPTNTRTHFTFIPYFVKRQKKKYSKSPVIWYFFFLLLILGDLEVFVVVAFSIFSTNMCAWGTAPGRIYVYKQHEEWLMFKSNISWPS